MINLSENMRDLIELVNEWIFDPLVEMSNLRHRDTGIVGIIFISTKRASHGPRIKYYPGNSPSGPNISISIEDSPRIKRIIGMSKQEANHFAKGVMPWIVINKNELLTFWNQGTLLDRQQVNDLIDNLKKI